MNNELIKYLNLKEELKLDSKYAEAINVITFIICFTIFCILPQFISTINTISVICLFYLISKLLNFMMFGSRSKRRKERILINKLIRDLK
jgi:hypothetical protein